MSSCSGKIERRAGWILDVYVSGACANLWIKLDDENSIRLTDSYRPAFYVELQDYVNPENGVQTISLHPSVYSAQVEERRTSILNRGTSKVVHIATFGTSSLRALRKDIEKLGVVKTWFNVDLYHFQRYLFSKTFSPTNKVRVGWNEQGKLAEIDVIDDSCEVSPPPFSSLLFKVAVKSGKMTSNVRQDPVFCIALKCENDVAETLDGAEADVLERFASRVSELDPDFLVASNCEEALHYIFGRAAILGVDLQLGRESSRSYNQRTVISATRGRAFAEMNDFLEYGVAGISELSRFALTPPTLAAKWPAGKTIDSRQNFESLKRAILIPERRGFPRFAMTAREIYETDKGGIRFSPVVGLHENVAELDFESMFPNIILRHNISYETVTPTCDDENRQGFLGAVVKTVLDRRLYFKHLRKKFLKHSKGYRWCNQRQKALKRILVCIYGFSGCFANRFNNVAAYNKINAISRRILVQTVNICLSRGFRVLYGNTDSIFVKRLNATQEDYEELARIVQRETGLPITLDKHYKFIVFMKQETHPNVEAMNRFFGKLTNGELNCRGIELRRRDCPIFLKEFQKRLIQILFDAKDWREIIESKVANAKAFVYDNYHRVVRGDIDPTKLAISKCLRKDVDSYKSMFPHVIAAKHLDQKGKKLEEAVTVDFIFTNAKHSNPLRRVIPAIMLSEGCNYYDRRKYGRIVLDVANTVLKTFEKDQPSHFTLDSFQK